MYANLCHSCSSEMSGPIFNLEGILIFKYYSTSIVYFGKTSSFSLNKSSRFITGLFCKDLKQIRDLNEMVS